MTEEQMKARWREQATRAMKQQEQQERRAMCEWCVVWFSQRLEEGRHAEL